MDTNRAPTAGAYAGAAAAAAFTPPTIANCPCLTKVSPHEPIFVLRGQDELAPDIIDLWADELESRGGNADKVLHARKTADAMRAWPTQKLPD